MRSVLFVLGTRPEAIKLLPLVWELQKRGISQKILHTDQHTDLTDDLLKHHKITPDLRLSIFDPSATISETKAELLRQMNRCLSEESLSAVLVQGDTLSALVGAEYGFLHRIPVVHIEAGMRSYRIDDPYPEEAFRRIITALSSLHFCPSDDEAEHLLREGVDADRIFTVGNTFADYWNSIPPTKLPPKKQILITLHRRENLPRLKEIFQAISEIAKEHRDYEFLFPMHPNPTILEHASALLSDLPNLRLSAPMPPDEFYAELCASELVITDSGGVQEECIFHAKKVIVVRKVSERRTDFPFSTLVDPEAKGLGEAFRTMLQTTVAIPHCHYYGGGDAAEKIANILQNRIDI